MIMRAPIEVAISQSVYFETFAFPCTRLEKGVVVNDTDIEFETDALLGYPLLKLYAL